MSSAAQKSKGMGPVQYRPHSMQFAPFDFGARYIENSGSADRVYRIQYLQEIRIIHKTFR